MAGTGGKRPGAGRKPGSRGNNSKLAEVLKAEFIKEYQKRKATIWKALFEKAEQGDIQAIKEANERAMGKVVPVLEPGDEATALFQIVIRRKDEQS